MQEKLIRFADIPGLEQPKSVLRTYVEGGRMPHAIMLSGPSGSGKMLLARALVNYAHCESPAGGEPCGHCRNCRLHAEMAHPDVHYSYPIVKSEARKVLVSDDLKPEWHRMLGENPFMAPEHWLEVIQAGNSQPMIHVTEAQDIVRLAAFPPYASARKFFVIWLPEKLMPQAANKLLKVIEEPAEGITFILVSNNDLEILPTITSRTQRISVIPDGGRPAPRTPSAETTRFREIFIDVMRNAYSRNIARLRSMAADIATFGREKTVRMFLYFASMIRENFIFNLREPRLSNLTPEEEAFSRNFSPFINVANVEQMTAETDRARRDIERNCNARIVLFDYFLLLSMLIRLNIPGKQTADTR